ncbi:MAG TPA: C4-type zinc ribbon domain-containing protein [Anaeromyxobacteraceae bacterium]|nr:C4-type zinc ribbon domain-containing protein [Anaeromyxobacteraceae bacterium]
MTLRETLDALEALQAIDLEKADVLAEGAELPDRRAEIEARLKEARRGYDEQRQRLEANERERRQLDQLLQMERDKVKKWEGRLGEIKTPREYAALNREIEIAKKQNEHANEQIKELARVAGEIQKAMEAGEEALLEREEETLAKLKVIDGRQAEIDELLRSFDARRAEAAKAIDGQLLKRYDNIRKRRPGPAIALVVGGTCRGCHRNIPPQLALVLARANSIESCPSCNRIIYNAEAVNPPAPSPS